MFLNPWRVDGRSAFNIAAARRFLALYVIWRILSYSWPELSAWPSYPFEVGLTQILPSFLAPARSFLLYVALGTVALLLVVLRRAHWRLAAATAAFLVIVLGGFHQAVDNQGKRFMLPALFLLIFAVFADSEGDSPAPGPEANPLCWILLALATSYALVVWHRMAGGHVVAWATADNLLRTIRWESLQHLGVPETFVEPFLHRWRIVPVLAAPGTLFVELSLLGSILLGLRITVPVLAVISMHLGILASMNLFFSGNILLLCMFLDWEVLHRRWKALRSGRVPLAVGG